MVQIAVCPPGTEVHEKLNAVISVTPATPCPNLNSVVGFPIPFDGVQGQMTYDDYRLEFRPLDSMHAHVKLKILSCGAEEETINGASFFCNPGGLICSVPALTFPTECCGPGAFYTILITTISDGPPIPAFTLPPLKPPPCSVPMTGDDGNCGCENGAACSCSAPVFSGSAAGIWAGPSGPSRGRGGMVMSPPLIGPRGPSRGGSSGVPIFSSFPIRYATGEIALATQDVESGGFGIPWGHTRSFNNRFPIRQTVGNGFNWSVEEWPYLVRPSLTTVAAHLKANHALWFDLSDGQYVARFGEKPTLTLDNAAQRYRLTELDGTVTEFDSVTGMFRRRSDAAGNYVFVKSMHANGYNFTEVERSYTSGGDTTTEQYLYDYETANGEQQLTRITLRRKVNAGAWSNVLRTNYTYYGTSDTSGSSGDLQTVTNQVWKESDWESTGTTLYRYYRTLSTSSSSSSSSSSFEGNFPASLLKYAVLPASYDRLAADPSVSDPLTASDLLVAQYADYYFEYDAQRRVTREIIHGGSLTFTYSFSESANPDGYNSWKTKTVETLPTGAQNIAYNNFAGYPMLTILKSGDDEWREFFKYDGNGNVLLHAGPSAITGYDDQYADLLHETVDGYEYLDDDDGLIRLYTFHGPTNYLASESFQRGQEGTPIKLRELEYVACCSGGSSSSSSSSSSSGGGDLCIYYLSKETVYPSDVDQDKTLVTTYAYTFHPGTCAIQQRTITLPVVGTDQNGSGVAETRKDYFDLYGNLTWMMDERGFITGLQYDIVTGALVQRIDDVDTAQVSDEPAGWETPTGGGLHLVTDYESDDQGRMTQVLGPSHSIDISGAATTVRRASWMVYQDADHEVWSGQGYASGSAPSYDYTLINPVSIIKRDQNGMVLEQIQATRASASGKLDPDDSFPQSSYVRWTTNQYTDCCLLSSTRVYHDIPASGVGSVGANYDESAVGYDSSKRQNRQVTPGGTITRTVFDILNRPEKIYVGTDDTGSTESDPTGGGASGNNMVLVTENEYDGGGVGDGNLTELTQWVDGSTSRVTSFLFDWRNRRTATDGEVDFYEKTYYDNLDRVIKSERYNATANGNLIGRSETRFDDRGRVYQSVRYGVNPSTGSVGNALTDNTWFDSSGNPIKQLPSGSRLFTKLVYDGLGRRATQYVGFDLDETLYSEADDVDGDTILEQTELAYDAASNVIRTALAQRYHSATGTGALNGPAGPQPRARITYSATWPDPLGRQQAGAEYGTNGGSSLSRPATIPARSDTVLVTSMTYDSAGQVDTQTNPRGIVSCLEYDDAGRQVKMVMNYVAASSSSSSGSSTGCLPSDDQNVTVLTAYNADGNVISITAVNSITGDQVTQYVYGTTLSDSEIASSLLKRKEIYPDSVDADDEIRFEYNRQGEVTEVRDQNGTIHAYVYDKLGRQTHDRVTTLGSGVDGAVRRISTSYEVRGMREKITSWNGETVGSGSVVNEVQFTYNEFGQVTADYQAHSGTVTP